MVMNKNTLLKKVIEQFKIYFKPNTKLQINIKYPLILIFLCSINLSSISPSAVYHNQDDQSQNAVNAAAQSSQYKQIIDDLKDIKQDDQLFGNTVCKILSMFDEQIKPDILFLILKNTTESDSKENKNPNKNPLSWLIPNLGVQDSTKIDIRHLFRNKTLGRLFVLDPTYSWLEPLRANSETRKKFFESIDAKIVMNEMRLFVQKNASADKLGTKQIIGALVRLAQISGKAGAEMTRVYNAVVPADKQFPIPQ